MIQNKVVVFESNEWVIFLSDIFQNVIEAGGSG
jgi:hypothetical protein